MIQLVFDLAVITYGPLLGLFAFGLFTRHRLHERMVPLVTVNAALGTFYLRTHSTTLFGGYQLGFETLLLNGLLTAFGLWLVSTDEAASGRTVGPAEASKRA